MNARSSRLFHLGSCFKVRNFVSLLSLCVVMGAMPAHAELKINPYPGSSSFDWDKKDVVPTTHDVVSPVEVRAEQEAAAKRAAEAAEAAAKAEAERKKEAQRRAEYYQKDTYQYFQASDNRAEEAQYAPPAYIINDAPNPPSQEGLRASMHDHAEQFVPQQQAPVMHAQQPTNIMVQPQQNYYQPQQAAIPVAFSWTVNAGQDLRSVLSAWSANAGVDFIWDISNMNFVAPQSLNLNGSYEEAVGSLLDIYAGQAVRPVASLHLAKGNRKKTLVVTVMR